MTTAQTERPREREREDRGRERKRESEREGERERPRERKRERETWREEDGGDKRSANLSIYFIIFLFGGIRCCCFIVTCITWL